MIGGAAMPGLRQVLLIAMILASAPSIQSQTAQRVNTVWDTVRAVDTVVKCMPATEVETGSSVNTQTPLKWHEVVYQILMVLIAGVAALMGLRNYLHSTRPIITFTLPGNPSGLRLNPLIENVSKTDAEAIVLLKIVVDGVAYDCEMDKPRMAYNGTEVWYSPARSHVRGNIGIGLQLLRILGRAPDPEIDRERIYIETSIHYRRWRDVRRGWWWFFGKPWPRTIYSAPVQRWQYYPDKNIWVLVPNFRCPRVPHEGDLSVFKRSPEHLINK
jgi:hypothetical protein